MTRVGLVQVWQEVNTYSPRPTTLEDFRALEYLTGRDVARRHRDTKSIVGGFLTADGFECLPILSARAWPAAAPDAATASTILADLDSALHDTGPLSGVLLSLHGAMVAGGHTDMELEVVRTVRRHVGDAPVIAVLDLHGNPSPEFVAACDGVIAYETYPHVDTYERGQEARRLMAALLGGTDLVTGLRKLPLLTAPMAQDTSMEPMRGLLSRAGARAVEAGVENVSLLPGFPYSDVPRAGFSIIATAAADRRSTMHELLDATATDVEACAGDFTVEAMPPAEAVMVAARSSARPVVLVDVADNVGGGGGGDGTAILEALLEQRIGDALVTLADAPVAAQCHAAGERATVEVELGGKSGPLAGHPIRASARVLALSDGAYTAGGSWETGQRFSMGPSARLQLAGGIQVVVTTRAVPPFHIEQLTSLGAAPAEAGVITAKGAVAWKAAFESVMGSAILVDAPGACPVDPWSLPRRCSPLTVRYSG